MYRSPLNKTKWKSEETTTTELAYLRTCRTQYPRGSLSNNMINTAAKVGWTRIPTVKSVKARNASKMLDLCALSRDFALTEIITSAFKTAVTGKLMMLKMMRKIRKVTPQGERCCSLLPNTRSDSQPAGLVVELKFMASRLTISDFPLLSKLVIFKKRFGRKTTPDEEGCCSLLPNRR